MAAISALTLTTVLIVVTSLLPQSSCRYNGKYRALGSSPVEYVTTANFSVANLPTDTHLEFRRCHFPSFGPDMFKTLKASTRRITFRKGTVREMLIGSTTRLERIQVIDTGLVSLRASDEPNNYLKQLTVRSRKFSEWSPSLTSLRMLEEIDVAYCNLSYLNVQWFEDNNHLKMLDVSKNGLVVFDIGMSSIPKLERLHLWGNHLKELQRFPEAFPKLKKVTLAQNRWLCRWVANIRGAIVSQGVELMDMDGVCRVGWQINGGLCCRSGEDRKAATSQRKTNEKSLIHGGHDFIGMNGSVFGMKWRNTIVYVGEPLPIL
ncbi:uncharacterized protein LOC5579282 [Aedes aegypti]|uniref:Uncharacterized protein n=1 Tax=Aedes aegypti TaxID=7159 RepID=A0A6I8U7X9_AEDAE|nr:uncharacterized protein LOC5579282 [Aedes aegypti]